MTMDDLLLRRWRRDDFEAFLRKARVYPAWMVDNWIADDQKGAAIDSLAPYGDIYGTSCGMQDQITMERQCP
jgi:hypothetical protein